MKNVEFANTEMYRTISWGPFNAIFVILPFTFYFNLKLKKSDQYLASLINPNIL
jgi:hypothetical protein